jgi:hypothetical protein
VDLAVNMEREPLYQDRRECFGFSFSRFVFRSQFLEQFWFGGMEKKNEPQPLFVV